VDLVAYQDEVGVQKSKVEERLHEGLRKAHDRGEGSHLGGYRDS